MYMCVYVRCVHVYVSVRCVHVCACVCVRVYVCVHASKRWSLLRLADQSTEFRPFSFWVAWPSTFWQAKSGRLPQCRCHRHSRLEL